MTDISEKAFKQKSAGQAAQRHQHITYGVICAMVVVMAIVTFWLIRMSEVTQSEIEKADPAKLNIPITASTAKAVTRKKEVERPDEHVPIRQRRPANTKPRPAMAPPTAAETQETDPASLPPGTLVF